MKAVILLCIVSFCGIIYTCYTAQPIVISLEEVNSIEGYFHHGHSVTPIDDTNQTTGGDIQQEEWISRFFQTQAAKSYVTHHETHNMEDNAYAVAVKAARYLLTRGRRLQEITTEMLQMIAVKHFQPSRISPPGGINETGTTSNPSHSYYTSVNSIVSQTEQM